MTSQKPYLIRAIYEWLLDNHNTPYLLVNTTVEGVQVPHEYINNGKIILNIEPGAVNNFHTDNEWISFSARFSGKPMELFIPVAAVLAIYSRENNEGMFFSEDEPPPSASKKPGSSPKKDHKPSLSIVK